MIRLAVRVRQTDAEVVLAELLELAPGGVEEVALPEGVVEYAVYGPPGELPALPDLRAAAGGSLVEIATSEVPDDWAERWRQFHRPVIFGERLAVRPPWEPPCPVAVEVVVDPGQAFGTGAHATTRLCLELMLEMADAGGAAGPLLDLGCGSGVLAIVAAGLGWDPVVAVDSDPLSLQATQDNAARNGVSLEPARYDLREGAPPPVCETVAANLLGPLLLILAGRLADVDEPARPRRLVASGLLGSEADGIASAFGEIGLVEVERRAEGDWAALLLGRGG